jgi:plastocyanin
VSHAGQRLSIAFGLAALLVLVPVTDAADQQITAASNSATFSPSEVTVNVGDTVTVSRGAGGGFPHNVHYDDQASGCPASPTTSSWSCPRQFTAAGDYRFHCDLHTSMIGTVHVTSPSAPPPTPTVPAPTPPPTSGGTPGAKTVPLGRIARVPKGCARRGSFRIRLRNPDGLSAARVFVNSKRVATRTGAELASRIKVRGIPKGRFTLRVEVTRTDGSRLTGKRRLRACRR